MSTKHPQGKLNQLSRRQLLKNAGLGAAAVALSQYLPVARAQDAETPALPIALKRFSLGDASVTLLQEATLQLPPAAFGGGAPEGAVAALLADNNLPTDTVAASVNIIMFDNGTDKVLFDTGTGQTLLPALEAIGVPATDITAVIFSHFHGDHVGGASFGGALTYPNATYYFPEAEWDFIQGASDNQGAQNAVSKLQPAEDAGQLELFTASNVISGVQAIFAPGHTPGHHIFDINSGDASLTFMADTANNYVTALSHPEWSFSFDSNPEQATETRREQYGRVADEQRRIVAYHFPFPGLGYIDRDGEGFNYFPA
jgi:glyoxylase-like metal-dependent hydrolase (beta-lactamase superfamily II)